MSDLDNIAPRLWAAGFAASGLIDVRSAAATFQLRASGNGTALIIGM